MNDIHAPDPMEFWEYASDEQIEQAIADDKAQYEKFCEDRDSAEKAGAA